MLGVDYRDAYPRARQQAGQRGLKPAAGFGHTQTRRLGLYPSQALLQSQIAVLEAPVLPIGQAQRINRDFADIEAHKALGLIVNPILVIHSGFAPTQPFGLQQ